MRKLKYVVFAGYEHAGIDTSGLFQWVNAFDKFGAEGTTLPNASKDILENYDIVHVNYTPQNASYIAGMREALGKSSDTKLIANVDYGIGLWDKTDPLVMIEMLNKADMVFHVEPYGAERLSNLLNVPVYCIPHPVDTELMKPFREAEDKKFATAVVWGCQYHRYRNDWDHYFYPGRLVKTTYNARTVLMNVEQTEQTRMPLNSFFDEIIGRQPYQKYLRQLSWCTLNMDITSLYTYGRGVVEAAALGVPTIAGDTCYAGRLIFPELCVTPGKDRDVVNNLKKLSDSQEKYHLSRLHGIERAEIFNLENSHERMMNALESAKLIG